jgi:hypothetical protein
MDLLQTVSWESTNIKTHWTIYACHSLNGPVSIYETQDPDIDIYMQSSSLLLSNFFLREASLLVVIVFCRTYCLMYVCVCNDCH